MAKARQVMRALEKSGWNIRRQRGSHRVMEKAGHDTFVFAWHDREDLGGPAIGKVAKQAGLTTEELRKLL